MHLLKKLVILHIVLTLSFTILPNYPKAAPAVSAKTAILMEQESGRVLYDKGMNKVRRIASITKIMTAILAIESGKLDETVKVSDRAAYTEGSSLYLKPGEKIKLEDLVYGLMLRSGNDSAVAIAEHVGGSLEGFVFMMNQKAQEIGMQNSEFANPHGLDDHENHYSTAYDMALLTRYAMLNEKFRDVSGTKIHRAPNPEEKWDRVWKNKNKLLTGLYEYCTGGKTGYTKRAKRTLVSTASKDGVDLIVVTLNAPDDWKDHANLFDWGFTNYDLMKVVEKGDLKNIEDEFYKNKVTVARDFYYPVTNKEKDDISVHIKLVEPNEEWEEEEVPVPVGKLTVTFSEENIGELPIYYQTDFEEVKESWFSIVRDFFLSMIGANQNG